MNRELASLPPASRAKSRALALSAAWICATAGGLAPGGVAAAPGFTDLRHIESIHGDAAAGARKAAVCQSCHGADGAPVAATFPRLSGQRIDYLYHRLRSFRHASAKDPYYSVSPMTPMAATLSDEDMRDLAAYFASQAPQVAAGGPGAPGGPGGPGGPAAGSSSTGEKMFLQGNPARGMPPCQGCHGADANGPSTAEAQYAAYPALRGQSPLYVIARLEHFREGQPADTTNAFIMHGVAATLDDDSIQAIAAWLASLEPRRSR